VAEAFIFWVKIILLCEYVYSVTIYNIMGVIYSERKNQTFILKIVILLMFQIGLFTNLIDPVKRQNNKKNGIDYFLLK